MIEIPLSIRSIYSKVSYTSKPFRNVSTVMETIIKPPLFSSISCSCLGAIFHGFLDNNHNHVSSYTNSCDIVLYWPNEHDGLNCGGQDHGIRATCLFFPQQQGNTCFYPHKLYTHAATVQWELWPDPRTTNSVEGHHETSASKRENKMPELSPFYGYTINWVTEVQHWKAAGTSEQRL